MGSLKLRIVGILVLVSMFFSMTGMFAAPVFATANLSLPTGPAPADPAVCMEDVTATVSWMNKFNLIVLDNVNAPGFTHVDGGAYIGGNYNATGASDFAIQSGPTCADTSLTIVGTVASGGQLKVLNGNATFGQATSSRIAMNSGCSATVDNTLSNATIKAELLSASSAFAAESANNSDPTIDNSGKLIFNVNTVTANGLAIFDVTGTQVFKSSANNQIEFIYGNGINASTTTILINVSESDIDWTSNASFGNSVETNAARILWNLHSATTIDFNKQWFGSMLAPLATLNANSQNLTGSIAVKNITGAGEIHKPRIALSNTNPLKDVCENPPDESTDDSVCSDIAGGPFNQLKVDVEEDGPPYAAWEYNPIVGATTSGTATYLGGSTTAGQSYSVAPFGTITISTTNSSGTIVAYNGTQDNTRTNWTSTFGIDYVLVKAGPGSNVYIYSPEAYADYLLESPKPSISHVTFCWDGTVTVEEDPGISIKKYTNGQDADTPTGPIVSAGSTVTWTYIVSNTGNVVLSNVVVTDNIAGVTPVYVSGDTNTDGKLDLNESWLFRTTGIAIEGQYANIGTVTGKSPANEQVSDTDPSHYFGADPGIAIKKYTNGQDADEETGPVVAAGSTVTWTYIVSNTGNVALSNIVVTDDIAGVNPAYVSGDTNSNGKLEVGEIWLFRATGIAIEGQYRNMGTVTGDSPDGEEPTDEDPSHYFGADPGISIKKYTNGEDADAPTGPIVSVGSTVTWTYIVENEGNVVLSNIVVTDNIAGVTPVYVSGDTNTDGKLDLNESWLFRTTGIATAGQYANIGSVKGDSPDGKTPTDEDPSHYFGAGPAISIKKYTNGEDADTPTGPIVSAGSTVTWTYIVSNTGNVVLSNVVVTDNIAGVTPVYVSGDTNTNGKLEVGEIWLFRATGIAIEGQYANIGYTKGTPPTGQDVNDNDPSHYFGADPAIAIKKYTNGQDADEETGPIVSVGSTVTWTYIVSNTGNVALSNIVVTDDIAGVNPAYVSGDTNTNGKLEVGEIWLFRATGIAIEGQYRNMGTVTGDSPNGEEPTDEDPSHYFGADPAISIKKYTNGEDADAPTGPIVSVGSTVTWTYIVENEGNVVLSNVVVTDNIAGVNPVYVSGDTNTDGKLDLNESWLFRATGIATAGQYANIGSVKGDSPDGKTPTDEDPSHYFGAGPAISIKKYTNGQDADIPTGPIVSAGSTVTWTYIVENEGNVVLSNVVVTDNIAGVTPVYVSGDTNTDGKLDLNESWLFRTTGIAIEGQYANIGTVTGKSPANEQVSDNDPSHYFGADPGIAIKKYTNGQDADEETGPVVAAGGTVTWTYIVSNTGNVALSNIVVTDDIAGVNPAYVSGDTNSNGKLEVGEIWLFRATGIAIEGQYRNMGTVTGDSPDGEEPTDEDPSHYFGADPGIAIKKYTNGQDADEETGPVVAVGSTVTWTYVVTNAGNVPLANVVVTDNVAGVTPVYISGDVNSNQLLDLTETWLYRTTGVAIEGQYANIGYTKGTPPAGPDVDDNDPSHYFGSTPPPPVLSSLGDRVWHDLDADGVQDEGEVGVPNVTVNLLQGDCSTSTGKSTTTDGNGIYGFDDLAAGNYCVEFDLTTLPTGFVVSPSNVGDNDAVDSDGNSSTGKTTSVTLPAGTENLTLDLGIYQPASLGNRVWIDANENGAQDEGEANVPGVTVTLFNSNNQPVGQPTVTDANGLYLFTNLVPGTYYVIFDPTTLPTDFEFTTPNAGGVADNLDSDADTSGKTQSVTLQSGDNYLDLDAGIVQPTEPTGLLSALGDTVWFDENKNGIQDGVGTPTGEQGVAGVVVNLYTAANVFVKSDTTDADGKYLFTDLQPGSYYVEFATVEGYSYTRHNVNSNSQDAADSDPVLPWIDITISTGDAEAELGEPLTYTVSYTNTDATLPATNVVISTTVPDGTTFNATASNPSWQCTNANPGGVCTLTLATLGANTSGSALFVVDLSTSEPNVPDQLDILIELTQGTTARTETVTLAAGETNLTVDAGLLIIESTLTTPTPTSPTNLPEGEQPKQQRAMFLPTVRSGQ